MRDIVWTVIVIWFVRKIYNAFLPKASSQPKNSNSSFKKEGEVKIDKNVNQKSRFGSNDGEYVDYEEIK